MRRNKIVITLFVILLIVDFVFSFFQYYQMPLYGDLEGGILPDKYVQQIIDDPFGFHAIKSGEKHINPNRFFSHYIFMKYFRVMPKVFQYFSNPISAVYLSAALVKIIVQLLFVYLLAFFISGYKTIRSPEFIKVAVLIAPLFQVYGYWSRMGINDKSIAYTFFYAVPLILLMLFFIPFFKSNFSKINYFILIPLSIILPLSGPLIPGVILIVSSLLFLNRWIKSYRTNKRKLTNYLKSVPVHFYSILIPVSLWSIYSLYLGFFYDINYKTVAIPLFQRYLNLFPGIVSQLFHSFGFPLMLVVIGVNIFLIKKNETLKGRLLIQTIKWIGVFSLLYILLLPLGGYRPYRPVIIRYDTIMPVTIALIYFFAASSYYLINNLRLNRLKYLAGLTICLLIYSGADFKGLGRNKCERAALQKIANSNDQIVHLPDNCKVISWEIISDSKRSEAKAELIYFWGITDKKKLFINDLKENIEEAKKAGLKTF